MYRKKLDRLIEAEYDFDIKTGFLRGWEIFKAVPIYSVAYTLLILSIQFLFVIYAPDFVFVFSVFLAGPMFAGFYLVANKVSQHEEVIYPDYFKGFAYYIPIILVWVVGQLLTVVGILLLVIPGIYLIIGYMFAILMNLFGGLDFWNSLEYSRKLIHKRWWKFLVFGLLIALLNIIGAFIFVFGLAVTIPVTYYAIYSVFEKITKKTLLGE
ncbi:hypothetical protein [Negadavirga shengliensis]|uniref:Membrane protein YesL n=1 Tax=Negadavirga shengliensis TaxID=1389218 RepID=A0ABV9T6Y0_9BACT